MSGDLIPEEAIEAAAASLKVAEVDATDPHAWFRGHAEAAVRAAAPLILAAELDRLAKQINERADACHNPADPATGVFSGGVMTAASIVSRRASVLRGEGQTQ